MCKFLKREIAIDSVPVFFQVCVSRGQMKNPYLLFDETSQSSFFFLLLLKCDFRESPLFCLKACFQTECNWHKEKFMAEKIRDKHSISPLGDMLLHQQRKWKADLSGLYVRRWLKSDYFPPTYCEAEFDLFITPNKHFNLIFPLFWHTVENTNWKERRRKEELT